MAKTPSLGIRVQPEVKEALERAAKDDVRTLSSMVEKIVVEWLTTKGYLAGPSKPADANAGDQPPPSPSTPAAAQKGVRRFRGYIRSGY